MENVPGVGLSPAEVALNGKRFGRNEITTEAEKPIWKIFTAQFVSPLVLILVAACALTIVLREWIEAIAILSILIANALIGFFQEFRAERAVLALKDMTAPRASVIRDGKQSIIPASEIVPDDLLTLEAGDVVAADAIILESAHFQMNESVLTGESLPVEKNAEGASSEVSSPSKSGQVFMGTAVAMGTARAKVTSIGMETELGKIAHLIKTAETPQTPLQLQLSKVGKVLLVICLGVVGLVLLLGWIHQRPWIDLVIFSTSLAVAVVPEGMPAIVTVALALGVRRMAKLRALVRKLPSVETLGSVSVVCTDKTGTLTTGKMRVREISGKDERELVIAAASCCDAELGTDGISGVGDPTELAILIKAHELGIQRPEIEASNPRQKEHPFDTKRKRMSIRRKDGILYVKGAFESVIPLCIAEKDRTEVTAIHQEMTSRGLRVLAVATGTTDEEMNLTYIGLIAIADPPREEAKQAISEARRAGISIVMITGDHQTTASAIAKELGVLVDGDQIEDRVHARATPQEKLKIVREWKAKGAIVAMTGDGVNDAPALREAHIGIAMGIAGTEVTRQAADLILADDNFATIISAVREGRGIYQNIRKATMFLLAGNFGELFAVLGASAIDLPLPFLASHLLWINLVTDSFPALALIADPVSSDVMKHPPRSPKEMLLGRPEWKWIGWVGALEGGIVLALFAFTLKTQGLEQARNLSFSTLVFSQLWRSFSARSTTHTLAQVGIRSNVWLLGVVFATAGIQLSLHFVPFTQRVFGLRPLSYADLGTMMVASLITVTVIEARKLIKGPSS